MRRIEPIARLLTFAAVFMMIGTPAFARTIIIDAGVADRMAGIDEIAPRQGWAAFMQWTSTYYTNHVEVQSGRSFLIRFALGEIPEGQRITHAELLLPVSHYQGTEPRFYVWRVLADWGPGVCHLYRIGWPKKLAWAMPGARGGSSDRGTRPSAIVKLTKIGEQVVNVTEDLELWYTVAAPNYGWIFTVEDVGTMVRFRSPEYDAAAEWKLRITYEPE